MTPIITLREYLEKGKVFVIPEYQRGYIWGKIRKGEKNSVENLLENLLLHYQADTEVFLQGITVTENDKEVVLIDGQQRTTCLLLLLKTLGYTGEFRIKYDVRKESNDFLEELDPQTCDIDEDEIFQDIYFFKKTVSIINERLNDIQEKGRFLKFVLDKIKFLYINIPANKATTVFSMMNGSKAEMLHEEVVKAEILRLASLNNEQCSIAQEWESNVLRNRYAREWDKWLHWWRKEDVQRVFGNKSPMGLLLSSYARMKRCELFTFEEFKKKCLLNAEPAEAKRVFDGLRRLQKRFEDAYNNPVVYNRIGAILIVLKDEGRQQKFIDYYFVEERNQKEAAVSLEEYYNLVFLGLTHDEIVLMDKEKFATRFDNTLELLNDDMLYMNNREGAFRFLLCLNINEDIKQNRKFNFAIWENRSLEHIFPKSKVVHKDENGNWFNGNEEPVEMVDEIYLEREKIASSDGNVRTTEHSIGNLVLLYKNENSQFNNSDFVRKKELFFSPKKEDLSRSRHLLHTVCVFAEKEKWNGEAIAQNKRDTIMMFEKEYNKLKELYQYEE
ncbi:MAG: DUF1524 domain-containing protein [Bacteroidaceae bacterium]|nr:DUF1524 domain-containing protein [Bacteroidaceae bacterium]